MDEWMGDCDGLKNERPENANTTGKSHHWWACLFCSYLTVNLTQPRVIAEESLDQGLTCYEGWCRKAWPLVGGAIPRQVVLAV